MKNKFSCVMALASMLFVSSLSTEVMASAPVANVNMGNMSNDMDYTAVVGATGSWLIPHGDLEMTLEVKDMKMSGFADRGDKPSLKDVKDKYGWAITGGVYSPMLLDNMLTLGVEASWIQTTPEDESKELFVIGASGNAPKFDNLAIGAAKDISGNVDYDGLKMFGVSANAKVNLPVSNGDMSFYIPGSIGMVWAVSNDKYCEKNCSYEGALSFGGGLGMSYSIGNGAQFGVEGKYLRINDLKVPFSKGTFKEVTTAGTTSPVVKPKTIDYNLDKDTHLKLSPSYFVVSGNFSVAF